MKIAFISSMYGATWGGSEELWGGAALVLLEQGVEVFAGVIDWPGPAPHREALVRAGCQFSIRIDVPSLKDRLLNRFCRRRSDFRLNQNPVHRDLVRFEPDLVVISQMFTDDGLEWMEFCQSRGLPYVTIVQAATEYFWPSDDVVARLRSGYTRAAMNYFVSRHNLHLCETQIASSLDNACVVWNPYSKDADSIVDWPVSADGRLGLACVGRIQPDAKGQDVLIDVLADPKWRRRPIHVTFYGRGCNREWAEAYCDLRDVKAIFAGHCAVREIWRSNHILVHPTRKEGMPITVVEAALCGRPAVATAVAGIPDFIKDNETGFLCEFPEASLFDEALERAWSARERWKDIGLTAAAMARQVVVDSPVGCFAQKLLSIVGKEQ